MDKKEIAELVSTHARRAVGDGRFYRVTKQDGTFAGALYQSDVDDTPRRWVLTNGVGMIDSGVDRDELAARNGILIFTPEPEEAPRSKKEPALLQNVLPFTFKAPAWANSGQPPTDAAEALQRAKDLADSYYALGVQSGIHSMIEWCGVMGEYCKMLECAVEVGVDPREVDQHHKDCEVAVPEFMVEYFTEKLGCQLKPFIRADRPLWRKLLEDWFEGE